MEEKTFRRGIEEPGQRQIRCSSQAKVFMTYESFAQMLNEVVQLRDGLLKTSD